MLPWGFPTTHHFVNAATKRVAAHTAGAHNVSHPKAPPRPYIVAHAHVGCLRVCPRNEGFWWPPLDRSHVAVRDVVCRTISQHTGKPEIGDADPAVCVVHLMPQHA